MNKNIRKKFLITGAAGFFGSHIAEKALSMGHEVIAIDIFNSETTPVIEKEKNITILKKLSKEKQVKFKIYKADVRDGEVLEKIFKEESPNIIIHAAALARDRDSMDIPLEFIQTNVVGSQNIINAAMKLTSIEQFIVISTRSAVGQAASASALMTEDELMRPINPYGATKLAMEGLFHSYYSDEKVPVKICRMQPMYGPRCRHDMFVWRILNSILTGEKIQKYGTGEGVRDWLYISDAVDAVFALINTEILYDVFNIGVGEMTSTNDLIRICEESTGKKANIENIDAVRGDAIFAGIADCTRIAKTCGWMAKIKIQDGIKKTYNYMKDNKIKS